MATQGVEDQNLCLTETQVVAEKEISDIENEFVKMREEICALEGIKILDLTRVLAGPYCTMILSDLGADVLKIERPKVGDDTRAWGPPNIGNSSCYFMCVNRNKKSVSINLKDPEGQKIVRELALQSDVLVENYIPGKMEEYGLDYSTLRNLHPKLVYCSINGYGDTGPYAKRAGYDVIAASIGGLLHITGPDGGDPCKPGVALTDLTTGLYAHGAIMAALFQRERTGLGQRISINLLSAQIASLVNLGANHLLANQEAKRWGTAHESIVPYQSFATANGYLTIGGVNERQFRELCSKLNRLELADDKRFLSNSQRVENRKVLVEEISRTLATKTNEQWLAIFHDASFAYGPINTLSQAFQDPQVLHSRIVQEIEHPTAGILQLVGPPVQYSASENRIWLPPPELGQHTDEVLQQRLGYSPLQIEQLRNLEIIH
uniref:EOG090X05UC n=1 Tax=Evadne anonyx TaxID=141404 RepID=A0A9N6WQ07_9CRUS|nr:EOG090X05UC [Evadne anonyx]